MNDRIQELDKQSYIKHLSEYIADMIVNRYNVLGPQLEETYSELFNSSLDTFQFTDEEYEEIYNNVDNLIDCSGKKPRLLIASERKDKIYLAKIEELEEL